MIEHFGLMKPSVSSLLWLNPVHIWCANKLHAKDDPLKRLNFWKQNSKTVAFCHSHLKDLAISRFIVFQIYLLPASLFFTCFMVFLVFYYLLHCFLFFITCFIVFVFLRFRFCFASLFLSLFPGSADLDRGLLWACTWS